jgi:hypothetical protein
MKVSHSPAMGNRLSKLPTNGELHTTFPLMWNRLKDIVQRILTGVDTMLK